jgi:hypothetical protein
VPGYPGMTQPGTQQDTEKPAPEQASPNPRLMEELK